MSYRKPKGAAQIRGQPYLFAPPQDSVPSIADPSKRIKITPNQTDLEDWIRYHPAAIKRAGEESSSAVYKKFVGGAGRRKKETGEKN